MIKVEEARAMVKEYKVKEAEERKEMVQRFLDVHCDPAIRIAASKGLDRCMVIVPKKMTEIIPTICMSLYVRGYNAMVKHGGETSSVLIEWKM